MECILDQCGLWRIGRGIAAGDRLSDFRHVELVAGDLACLIESAGPQTDTISWCPSPTNVELRVPHIVIGAGLVGEQPHLVAEPWRRVRTADAEGSFATHCRMPLVESAGYLLGTISSSIFTNTAPLP